MHVSPPREPSVPRLSSAGFQLIAVEDCRPQGKQTTLTALKCSMAASHLQLNSRKINDPINIAILKYDFHYILKYLLRL